MSDELSAIVRAAASYEAAAAEREFPYSAATLGRLIGKVRRRRAAGTALLALVAVAVLSGAALGLGRPWQADPAAVYPLATTTSSATLAHGVDPTPSPTPCVGPTPWASPTPYPAPTPCVGPAPTPWASPAPTPAPTPWASPTPYPAPAPCAGPTPWGGPTPCPIPTPTVPNP